MNDMSETAMRKQLNDRIEELEAAVEWQRGRAEKAEAKLKESVEAENSKGFDEYGFYGENNPPVGPMSSPSDKDYEV